MFFKENLKYLREKNHETQSDLASFLNVCKSTICHYELGNSEPNLEQIIVIAEHYGVLIEDLLKEKMNPEVFFAKNLKYLRQRRNLSQEELADSLYIAQSSVANYESGRREADFKMVIEMARFFCVTLDALLAEDIEEANKCI